jgi:hypothetical protein
MFSSGKGDVKRHIKNNVKGVGEDVISTWIIYHALFLLILSS